MARKDLRLYTPLDVNYPSNPKWFKVERLLRKSMPDAMPDALRSAMRDAMHVHLTSICYCAANFTDGIFPVDAVKGIARTDHEEAVTALFETGMWINLPDGMAELHDFLDHNPSSVDRNRASENARKAAKSRWEKDAVSNAVSNASRMEMCNAKERKGKESIDTPSESPKGDAVPAPVDNSRKPAKRATAMPKDWAPSQDHVNLVIGFNETQNVGWGISLMVEVDEFKSWTASQGRTFKDWDAAFRNHLNRQIKRGGYRLQGPVKNPAGFTPTVGKAPKTEDCPTHGWGYAKGHCGGCAADHNAGEHQNNPSNDCHLCQKGTTL